MFYQGSERDGRGGGVHTAQASHVKSLIREQRQSNSTVKPSAFDIPTLLIKYIIINMSFVGGRKNGKIARSASLARCQRQGLPHITLR